MDPIFVYRTLDPVTTDGPLQGLRVALQPNLAVEDWPTEAGSRALAGYTAPEDATIVQRLRTSGAHLSGSTHMSEFGFGLAGSRAGAALWAGQADVELVLDLMGESRVAAAHAGVYGLKPSYGLVSRFGLVGLIPSMECCGVLSADLDGIRAVLRAVVGQDGLDFSLPEEPMADLAPEAIDPGRITVGVVRETQEGLGTEQEEAVRSAIDGLAGAGFAVREVSLPEWSLYALVHRIVGSVEASSAAGRYDSVRYGPRAPGAKNWNEMYLLSRAMAFGTLLKSYLIQGAYFQFERYAAFEDASRIRARLVGEMRGLLREVDFLVVPTAVPPAVAGDAAGDMVSSTSGDAPASLDGTYAQFAATLFANVTGQPVLYVPPAAAARAPAERAGTGLTAAAPAVGLQLAGPRLSDGRLLALGEYLQNTGRGGK